MQPWIPIKHSKMKFHLCKTSKRCLKRLKEVPNCEQVSTIFKALSDFTSGQRMIHYGLTMTACHIPVHELRLPHQYTTSMNSVAPPYDETENDMMRGV